MFEAKKIRRFRRLRRAILVLLLGGSGWPAVAAGARPAVIGADPQVLAASKAAWQSGSPAVRPLVARLLKDADSRLDQTPPSVMEKKQSPPSGDKHDYLSQAPYYWRTTNSPEAKYVRRDGERNPEANADSDAGRLGKVCTGVQALGLAYYFTGDEKYAAKAAELMRVFFLDPATRMNPNLKYGQGIPGEVEGRPAGLISARVLADLVDGVGLLGGSQAWTAAEQQKLAAWETEYFHWLTTSKIGRGEDAAANNHGTYFDVQAVAMAWFIGNTNYAREQLLAARQKRIARQIEPDGRMPRELARTLSFNYSVFNLRAEMNLADLGRALGVDLWHYQTPDGRSLLKAVEFLAPYADPQRPWPYPQIHKPNRSELGELLFRAAAEFPASVPIKDGMKFYRAEDLGLAPLSLKLAPVPPPTSG